MKYFLLPIAILLCSMVYSQNIEFDIKIDSDVEINRIKARTSDGGFVSVSQDKFNYFSMSKKEFKTIKLNSVKFTMFKWSKNSTTVYPLGIEVILTGEIDNNLFIVVKKSNFKERSSTFIKCTFSKDLELINEDEVIKYMMVDDPNKGRKYYRGTVTNMKKMHGAPFIVSSKVRAYHDNRPDIVYYSVFDLNLNELKSDSIFMDGKKSFSDGRPHIDRARAISDALSILQEGDLIINLEGSLYLIEEDKLLPIPLELEKSLIGYEILQTSDGQFIVVGIAMSEDNTSTQVAIIRLDDLDLSIKSETYLNLHSDFEKTPSDLLHEIINTPVGDRDVLGNRGNMKPVKKHPSIIQDVTYIESDESIRIVLMGVRGFRFKKAEYLTPIPQNFDVLRISDQDSVINESIIPFDFSYGRVTRVFNTESSIVIIGCDYKKFFNDDGEYVPYPKSISPMNMYWEQYSYSYNFLNGDVEHKKLQFTIVDNLVAKPESIEPSFIEFDYPTRSIIAIGSGVKNVTLFSDFKAE